MQTHTLPLAPINADLARATKSRLGGSRVSLIVSAWHAIDPRCVICLTVTFTSAPGAGQSLGDKATFGHVVPASLIASETGIEGRGGYTPNNGVLVCLDCQHAVGSQVMDKVRYVPTYYGQSSFPKTAPRVKRETAGHKREAQRALGY